MPQSKRSLVLGATPNPQRYAFLATNMLLEHGHEVVLFGIKKGEIANIPIRNEWPADEQIDTITMYISKKWQEAYYEKILALAPKRIIFNPGTENHDLVKLANEAGIETMDACTLVLLQTNQY